MELDKFQFVYKAKNNADESIQSDRTISCDESTETNIE